MGQSAVHAHRLGFQTWAQGSASSGGLPALIVRQGGSARSSILSLIHDFPN